MHEFIVQYWTEFLFSIVISAVGLLYKRYKALNQGMQALLRSQLYSIYNEAIDKGYCPIHKKEQASDIYEAYHALHANGTGTQVFNDIMEIPTKPNQKGDNKDDYQS